MDTPVAGSGILRMTRADYRRWAEEQPHRHELVHGEVIQMAPERRIHALLKSRLYAIFEREIRRAGLACQALPDGMTVEVSDDTDYEPDVQIDSAAVFDDDDIAARHPVVVVEVLSPGTRRLDLTGKLADYFRVLSIQHYLVVRAKPAEIIHYRRRDGLIETRIVTEGTIRLDPPGISFDVAEVFAP